MFINKKSAGRKILRFLQLQGIGINFLRVVSTARSDF